MLQKAFACELWLQSEAREQASEIGLALASLEPITVL